MILAAVIFSVCTSFSIYGLLMLAGLLFGRNPKIGPENLSALAGLTIGSMAIAILTVTGWILKLW